MRDDKRDQFVDELLDASLKQYGSEEPRSGLEMRILAGIRTRERAARRRWLGWAVAVCAGIFAIIVLTLHFARAPLRQPAHSVSLPLKDSGAERAPLQPPVAQQPPLSFGAQRAPLQMRGAAARVRRDAARRSRPEKFPTPLPLTEQEKLLLAYLNKGAVLGLVSGPDETGEASVSDLKIEPIKIADLEIKPLDDSQSDQEK